MLVLKWLAFLLIGKIVIHTWMQFHLPKFLKKSDWFVKLHDCDFCSGVWAYSILSLFLGVDLLSVITYTYVPYVSQIVTGIVVSWLIHIFSLGWKAKYEIVVV